MFKFLLVDIFYHLKAKISHLAIAPLSLQSLAALEEPSLKGLVEKSTNERFDFH